MTCIRPGLRKLDRRNIDGDADISRPSGGRGAGLPDHPFPIGTMKPISSAAANSNCTISLWFNVASARSAGSSADPLEPSATRHDHAATFIPLAEGDRLSSFRSGNG